MANEMWKISNNAKNMAGIFSAPLWGPSANCCTPFAAGTIEFNLHKQFPFTEFQKISNAFFQGPPSFPEHGECCANYGGITAF